MFYLPSPKTLKDPTGIGCRPSLLSIKNGGPQTFTPLSGHKIQPPNTGSLIGFHRHYRHILGNEYVWYYTVGVGGQGYVLLSALIGTALIDEEFRVGVSDTLGVSQRGRSVTSHIKVPKMNPLAH